MALLLAETPLFEVIGVAALAPALEMLPAQAPDIVLLDASAPHSDRVARAVGAASPTSKIVAFALADSEEGALACAEAGVAAFVGSNASAEELVAALEQVRRGEFSASPRLTSMLMGRLADLARHQARPAAKVPLTQREREIVPLIERGLSNKEIARLLSIEASTIKNHVHNILDKLELRRRGEVAARVGGRAAFSVQNDAKRLLSRSL
jgi:two-component system, NarL family, nitrate/nitrite response regulator NarL